MSVRLLLENKKLRKLAYEDDKFDVMNGNAFNLAMTNVNKDNAVMIRLGIRNVRAINAQNQQYGDNLIKLVAKMLSDEFGRKNVYRVMGDQFIVLLEDDAMNEYYNRFKAVLEKLYAEQVSVAYGVSVGATAKDIQAFRKAL